jgi:hypothetical protein
MFCLQLGTVLTETRTDHHVSFHLISLHATQHTSHTYCRDTSIIQHSAEGSNERLVNSEFASSSANGTELASTFYRLA